MKTYISWQSKEDGITDIVPDDWDQEWGNLPEDSFECGRLEKGDKIDLLITPLDGGLQEYSLIVVEVVYTINYSANGQEKMICHQCVTVRG